MEGNPFTNGNYVLVLFWRKNQVLIEEKTLQKKFRKHFRTLQNKSSEKIVIFEEELYGIHVLEDCCSSMKNVGILKYSLMVESLSEILTIGKDQMFYKPLYVQSVTNVID